LSNSAHSPYQITCPLTSLQTIARAQQRCLSHLSLIPLYILTRTAEGKRLFAGKSTQREHGNDGSALTLTRFIPLRTASLPPRSTQIHYTTRINPARRVTFRDRFITVGSLDTSGKNSGTSCDSLPVLLPAVPEPYSQPTVYGTFLLSHWHGLCTRLRYLC
jgi:hypothetical protein